MEGPNLILDVHSKSLLPHRIKSSILEIGANKAREKTCVFNPNGEKITPLEDLLSEF